MDTEQWLQAAVVGLAAFTARITLKFITYLIDENRTLRTETLRAMMAMSKAVTAEMKARGSEHKAILDAIAETEPKRVA